MSSALVVNEYRCYCIVSKQVSHTCNLVWYIVHVPQYTYDDYYFYRIEAQLHCIEHCVGSVKSRDKLRNRPANDNDLVVIDRILREKETIFRACS